MSALWWRFTIFGILGVCGEVFFNALLDIFRNRRFRLQGFSFIWMLPIYGLLGFLFHPVAHTIAPFPLIVRGVIYMAGIFIVEYITGTLLTALTGSHIWRYEDRLNYKGQVTLFCAPVWFAVGLLVEKYYPWVERVSRLLASS